MAGFIAELGDSAFDKMLAQECGVVFGGDTFKCHTKKIIVCFKYSLRHAETLGMGYTIKLADSLQQAVVGADGVRITTAVVHNIVNLYVAAKTHYLVAYGMLESQHYANRYYHHSQTDSYSDGSYTNSWATHFSFVALITIYLLSYV